MKKKIIAVLLALALIMSLAACGKTEDKPAESTTETTSAELKDGTYSAEAEGYGGPMEIEIAIKDSKIESIEMISGYETPGVGLTAIEKLTDTVVAEQSIDIDSISGATVTSVAYKKALKEALSQAGDTSVFEKEIERPSYEDEKTADVIIVGGGGAGLAAAIEASEDGSSVIILEKTGLLGGNTVVAGGGINAPDPAKQEPAGIEDSPEFYMEQTLEGGDNVANPELVKVLSEKALDGYKWLESLGVEFEKDIIQGAGSLYPRFHQAIKPLGTGFIDAYEEKLVEREDRVEILYNTTGTDLIVDGDRVVGLKATNPDGSELTLNANKGVILATGGFSKNTDMVLEHNTTGKWPNLDKDVVSTNRDYITGDGILMAQEIGADVVDMEQLQFLYLGIPNRGPIDGLNSLGAEKVIFVNNQGERFVREDGRRDVISSAIFEQEDGQMWLVQSSDLMGDEDIAVSLEDVPMKYLIDNNVYGWVKGDTIEELAEKIGCDPDTLQNTFDEYNEAVDKDEDEFGRELLTNKLDTPPYYAVPRVPSLHHTMGGVKIDTLCRVLDTNNEPIRGLYAAGEITGGIHGANRLGGNAITDIVVFGRIAGTSAANEE